jgi:hypothetical protein
MADQNVYQNFCDKVFKIDKHVRFVGIVDGATTFTKMREGLESLLTPHETREQIDHAISTWEFRKNLTEKLGEFVYSMSIYKNVKRITIPFNEYGLILVSMDPKGFHEITIEEILEIKNLYLNV